MCFSTAKWKIIFLPAPLMTTHNLNQRRNYMDCQIQINKQNDFVPRTQAFSYYYGTNGIAPFSQIEIEKYATRVSVLQCIHIGTPIYGQSSKMSHILYNVTSMVILVTTRLTPSALTLTSSWITMITTHYFTNKKKSRLNLKGNCRK